MPSAAAQAPAPKPKLFNDAVHGHIALDPLCVTIIDTPEFQRLRSLKQLGGCYLVFPTASHNRFEHSLGVCYLAGRMVDHLADVQPELGITDEERLCVRIAGLCHDLGHGPLSHAFESCFLPAAARSASRGGGATRAGKPAEWHHEWASVRMLEHLVGQNGLMPAFEARGLSTSSLHFVQELILGGDDEAPPGFVWEGRPGKSFLYDIVANKANGIDTDKGDYFMRDAQMLGMRVGYDWGRMLQFARVAEFEKTLHVCFQEKEAWQLYELFHSRYTLHKRAYQHRVAKVAELMLVEALLLADPHVRIPGSGGALRSISESVHDMEAYSKLSDTIFSVIEVSSDPKLAPAQDLLRRVRKRQLYAFAGQFVLPGHEAWLFPVTAKGRVDEVALRKAVVANTAAELRSKGWDPERAERAADGAVIADAVRLNYGQGATNPMESVGFFARSDAPGPGAAASPAAASPVRAFRIAKEHVSALLPTRFEENTVRAFVRSSDPDVVAATKQAFRRWCSTNIVDTDRVGRGAARPATPPEAGRSPTPDADPGSAPPTAHASRARPAVDVMSPLSDASGSPLRRKRDRDDDEEDGSTPAGGRRGADAGAPRRAFAGARPGLRLAFSQQ